MRSLEGIATGELMMYISEKSASNAEKRYALPRGVIGIYDFSVDNLLRFKKPTISLWPGVISIEGKEHPQAVPTGSNYIPISSMVDLFIGKNEILQYMESRPDLATHKEWISRLEEPYSGNFPQIKRFSFI